MFKPIYSFFMYYYTMPIQRSYFPIFNFVALGKVAVGIDRVDGQIRRKSCMISCSLHQAALESLRFGVKGQKERVIVCSYGFFSLFKSKLLSAASSVGVKSIMNRFSLIRHRGTRVFFSSGSIESAIYLSFNSTKFDHQAATTVHPKTVIGRGGAAHLHTASK